MSYHHPQSQCQGFRFQLIAIPIINCQKKGRSILRQLFPPRVLLFQLKRVVWCLPQMASAKFDLTVVVSTPMASLFKRSRVLPGAVHMRKRKVRRRSRMQRKLEERVALRQKPLGWSDWAVGGGLHFVYIALKKEGGYPWVLYPRTSQLYLLTKSCG